MRISNRDLATVSFVARFGQVTASHVRSVVFADNASATPCARALNRLVSQKLLARIERRTVGGARGGSGQFVYQIGSAGWKLASSDGTYWQARSVNYHSLSIAEAFTSIYTAQSDTMQVIRFESEPDSHTKVNYIPLMPDLYLELKIGQVERRCWLEIDLGTERPKQLRDKMSRYHDAWMNATETWNPWPLVVWVVPDDRRKREIESLIALQPKESRPMFRIGTFEEVAEVVTQ